MAAKRIETVVERLFGKEFSSLNTDLLSGLPAVGELARDMAAGRLTSLRAGLLPPPPPSTGSFTAASGAGAGGVSSGYGGTSSPGRTASEAGAGPTAAGTLSRGDTGSTSSTGGGFVVATMDGFPNTPPSAGDDYYDLPHDTILEEYAPGVMWNDWDMDMDPLSASLVSGPANAQFFQFNSDGSFTYQPTAMWAGSDSFTYQLNDGIDEGNVATVTIDVINNPPVALGQHHYIPHDTDLYPDAPGVLENDYDPDGDQITAVLYTGPSHATLC